MSVPPKEKQATITSSAVTTPRNSHSLRTRLPDGSWTVKRPAKKNQLGALPNCECIVHKHMLSGLIDLEYKKSNFDMSGAVRV